MSFSDSSSTSHAPRVCCQASEGLQTCTSILRLDLKLGTWRCPELNLKRGSSSLKSVSRISPVVVYPGQVLSYTPTFQSGLQSPFQKLALSRCVCEREILRLFIRACAFDIALQPVHTPKSLAGGRFLASSSSYAVVQIRKPTDS